MAGREIYNTIDCKERLLLMGIGKDEYGGYKQELLENELGETEIDFYICVKCIGLMRNACLVNGPDQILVCEVCKKGEDLIPMVKARKNIPKLRAKCPLMKRGCVWKGSLGEIDGHLDECTEFILNCSNVCDVLLKRSELQNHCENECQLRIVECKYCSATIHYKVLKNHNKICLEFPLVCPNECLKSVIRKELDSHIEKECPNTLITCPYKEMGCEVLCKRSELPKHEKTFESKHFDETKVFYFNKMKKMESIIHEKEDEIKRLSAIQFTSKSQERPNPSLDESFITGKEHSNDCKDKRTKSMCVIGLQNLGNTSYLNSALQNLLYLRPFRDQLIHTMTRIEYKLVPEKHPDLETITFAYSDKKAEPGKLTEELFKLIKETAYQSEATERSHSKKSSKKVITPRSVQNEIGRKHRKFSNGSQQDSHELLRILIDIVKDEEIKRLKAAFLDHFDIKDNKSQFKNYPEGKKKLLRKYASEFENILVFTDTFIDDTFGGKMISTVECDSCRKILYINEDFLNISLYLSEDRKEVYANDSLEFYLRQFFSPKLIEKEYVCNSCNPQLVSKQNERKYDTDSIDYDALIFTSAVKQFHIKTVGPVLTIHLKRFSQTGYGLQKLNKRVDFPLVLDMSPFCVSDTSVLKNCDDKILYGLRGIVEHSGGIVTRDYVAYVNIADWNVPAKITSKDNKTAGKRPNCTHVIPTEEWYYLKDSFVSRINHDDVFSSQACILFYERLPIVTRDRDEEIGIQPKNNSELCETRDAAAKGQERPNPSLDQPHIQSTDCKGSRTKSMCVIGLQNLGKTSYFNSVLQNLLYLRPFREQLIHTMTRTEYKLVPKKHPYLETITFSFSKKAEPGKLMRGLFKLMKETIYEKSSRTILTPNIIMPWNVQNEIACKSGKFPVGSQQDSHELFRFLIDMVKEEEIQQLKTAFFYHFDIKGNKTKFNNYSEELLEKYASEFENISLFNGAFIDDTFGGKMTSIVECLNCGKMISLNEVFLDISLPLEGAVKREKSYFMQFLPKFLEDDFFNNCNPQLVSKQDASHTNIKSNGDKSKEVKRLNRIPHDYPEDSLEYYLMRFFSPIFLEDDYVCNNCNPQLVSNQDENDDTDSIDYDTLILTSAVKQFHIKSVGPVLTIHLKRFSQTGYGLQKLNKRVDFPLVLDMSPFCVSDTSVLKDCNNKISYGLRGIVDHSGGMLGGNYVAYVNIADWNKPSKTFNNDSAKSNMFREINGEITSTDQPMVDSAQKNENDAVSFTSKNSTSEPPIQPTPTPDSHLYEHVQPAEEWYYICDSHVSKTNHNHVFSSQAYMLFYERLPLVPRDRAKEVGTERKNNSESVACKTKEAATNSLERPKPYLNQSYIMEKRKSVDCKENRTKYMHVIGLSNLGNTDYFNSVLQNLLYLRPFSVRLSYTMTRTEYKLVPKKHPELETIEFASDKKAGPGQLTQELFNLIQETIYQSEATDGTFGKKARKNTQKIVKPKAVQIEISKKHGKFSDGTQQDSHELFRFMIDMVKDEEIKRLKITFDKHFNIKDNKTQSKNCSVNRKILKKYASEFENIFMFTGTFIDDTFGGKMICTVKCEGCGSILDINEDFLDISLPLPEYSQEYNIKVKSKELKGLNRMPNYCPKDSLEYYLMRFFSPIFLEDNYVCNNCNPQLVSNQDETSDTGSDENDNTDSIDYDALKFTSAVKQFHIKTVGPVLTIHLKRFSQTGYGLQKLDKRVDFPPELDMSPFCVSDTSVLKDCNNKILYGLRGIVAHSGGMLGGHYVAYVNIADWNVPSKIPSKDIAKSSIVEDRLKKATSTIPLMDTVSAQKNVGNKITLASENSVCPPQLQPTSPITSHSHLKHVMPTEEWYYISDSHISKSNHDHVFSSQAYILFYERLPLVDRYSVFK